MNTYKYVTGNGEVTSSTGVFEWRSLCHNEGLMDACNMFIETGGFGWNICRRCGRQAHFIKRWPR